MAGLGIKINKNTFTTVDKNVVSDDGTRRPPVLIDEQGVLHTHPDRSIHSGHPEKCVVLANRVRELIHKSSDIHEYVS